MVYQEQVMRILNRLGGIELASAYTCIKAISKKKQALIDRNREKFMAGSVENGLAQEGGGGDLGVDRQIRRIRLQQEPLDGLRLDRVPDGLSESPLSGRIHGRTAVGRHSGPQFHAQGLAGRAHGRLGPHGHRGGSARREYVAMSISRSIDGKIYFRPVRHQRLRRRGGRDAIVADARRDGPFRDLFDFCERVDAAACNRSTIETLIKAGAFDSFGARRAQLMAVIDRAMQAGAAALADRRSGQKSLFGEMEDEEEVESRRLCRMSRNWTSGNGWSSKRKSSGFYLSSHPLAEYRRRLSPRSARTPPSALADVPHRTEVIMGGMLSAIKFAHVRKCAPGPRPPNMPISTWRTCTEHVRCILWPDDFLKYGELVQPDAIVLVRGAVDRRGGDEANLIVNELIPLDQLDSRYTSGVVIRVDQKMHGDEILPKVREIVRGYPGGRELQLILSLDDGSRVHLRSQRLQLDINPELKQRVEDLLGPGNYQLITTPPKPSSGNGNGRRGQGGPRRG